MSALTDRCVKALAANLAETHSEAEASEGLAQGTVEPGRVAGASLLLYFKTNKLSFASIAMSLAQGGCISKT